MSKKNRTRQRKREADKHVSITPVTASLNTGKAMIRFGTNQPAPDAQS